MTKYYDNRKGVATSTHNDLARNNSAWQNCLSMLTEKKIYHTASIITNHSVHDNDWDYVQYWVDQGYTEAGSEVTSATPIVKPKKQIIPSASPKEIPSIR